MATEFTPQQVASLITVADRTLRHWSSRFADYLSPTARSEATGRGNSHRKYTAQDVEMLRRIKLLSEQKIRLSEIEQVLSGRRELDVPETRSPIPISRNASLSAAPIEQPTPQIDALREMASMLEENRHLLAALHDQLTLTTHSFSDRLDALQSRLETLEKRSNERLETLERRSGEKLESLDRRLLERIQVVEQQLLERETTADVILGSATGDDLTNGGGLFGFLRRRQRARSRVSPLSRNLIRLMAARRWGRNDLALYSHVRVETITRILSGDLTDPKPQVLEALAQALGTSVEVLSDGAVGEGRAVFSH